MKDRTAALNRRKHARHRLLKRQIKNRLDQIGRQIKALDAEIATLIAADEEMSRQARVLASVPGIAEVTAAGLLAEMPELGRLDAKAAASLAGSGARDPRVGRVEGPQLHPRRTGAGAAHALHGGGQRRPPQPGHGRKYRELRERGKPPKVALTAVMRKMVVLANALLKQDRLWSPNPAAAGG